MVVLGKVNVSINGQETVRVATVIEAIDNLLTSVGELACSIDELERHVFRVVSVPEKKPVSVNALDGESLSEMIRNRIVHLQSLVSAARARIDKCRNDLEQFGWNPNSEKEQR